MHSVRASVDRPNRALVSEFEGIPTSILADVQRNARRVMESSISPVFDGIEMAGSAITVDAAPGDNLIIHKAITMAEPGDVLVIDGSGFVETAFIGELMSMTCQVNGAAGIVIDGAIRDREGIASIGFPVFAKGVHPAGPAKRAPGSINTEVSCGGVVVEAGDIVVGDGDGVIVVPSEKAASVLENAGDKINAEEVARGHIKDGHYSFYENGYDELFKTLDISTPDKS